MTVTITEAAELIGRPESTLRTWVERRRLEPVRRGARPLRFHVNDLVEAEMTMRSAAERGAIARARVSYLAQDAEA